MKGNTRSSLIVNIFMIIVVLVCLFPVLWMCAIAVKPVGEPVSGFNALTIGSPTLSNFSRLFELIPVMHNLFNSAFTTILGTITCICQVQVPGTRKALCFRYRNDGNKR